MARQRIGARDLRQGSLRRRQGTRHGGSVGCVSQELSDRILCRSGARLHQEAERKHGTTRCHGTALPDRRSQYAARHRTRPQRQSEWRAPLAAGQPLVPRHLARSGRSELAANSRARWSRQDPARRLRQRVGRRPDRHSLHCGREEPATVPIAFSYADESDPGPYPVPPDAPIEGGSKATGDRHIIMLDRDSWVLWELFNAFPDGKGGWKADSGASWDLRKTRFAPAAGLPRMPPACRSCPGSCATTRRSAQSVIAHALRFTLAKTRRAYVPPASHWASSAHDADLAPMGMRVRLKAGFDISGFAPEVRAILQALKKYGMILAETAATTSSAACPTRAGTTTRFASSCGSRQAISKWSRCVA